MEGDAEEYNVLGARLNYDLTDQLQLGVSRTQDDHETEGFDLTSVSAQYKLDENTRINVSSGSMSPKNNDPVGRAQRNPARPLSSHKRPPFQW